MNWIRVALKTIWGMSEEKHLLSCGQSGVTAVGAADDIFDIINAKCG